MAPTATIDTAEVLIGPGLLYVADVDTAEPVSASATLDTDWREVGYTDEGSAIDLAYTNVGIPVEEEFYPIRYVTTAVEMSIGFSMKQASRRNLALALNAGADAANDATSFEPPAPGTEVRVKLLLVTDEGALWVFRQCFQGGNLQITRRKAPNVALLPVQFRLEKPTGAEPFIVYPTADGLI
ncbi:MAG TPA: hypothetical protein VGE43_19375 [Acidimicrobiales bacterium]